MNRIETPLEAALKGALAGLAGGIAILLAMQTAEQFMPSPPSPPEGPPPERPREKLVRKIANCIFEVELPEEQEANLSQALHWLYSAFWGIVYGIVRPSLRLRTWSAGTLLGTMAWVVGPVVLLPAMKLSPPQHALPAAMIGMGWVFHLIFGLATSSTYHILSFCRRCVSR